MFSTVKKWFLKIRGMIKTSSRTKYENICLYKPSKYKLTNLFPYSLWTSDAEKIAAWGCLWEKIGINMVESFFRNFLDSSASNAKGCPCIESDLSTVCSNCNKKRNISENILHILYQKPQCKTKGTSTFELRISVMIYDVTISNYQSVYKWKVLCICFFFISNRFLFFL